MDSPLTFIEMLVRLTVAAGCGAVIGWERERNNKPAGLRTHMLVAVGSAGFTLVTWKLCVDVNGASGSHLRLDPSRLIQGLIGGIGFLGAGAIVHSRGSVRGVTTAAAIWVVGGIGLACGFGYFKIATVVVVTTIAILYPLGFIEDRMIDKGEDKDKDKGESNDAAGRADASDG